MTTKRTPKKLTPTVKPFATASLTTMARTPVTSMASMTSAPSSSSVASTNRSVYVEALSSINILPPTLLDSGLTVYKVTSKGSTRRRIIRLSRDRLTFYIRPPDGGRTGLGLGAFDSGSNVKSMTKCVKETMKKNTAPALRREFDGGGDRKRKIIGGDVSVDDSFDGTIEVVVNEKVNDCDEIDVGIPTTILPSSSKRKPTMSTMTAESSGDGNMNSAIPSSTSLSSIPSSRSERAMDVGAIDRVESGHDTSRFRLALERRGTRLRRLDASRCLSIVFRHGSQTLDLIFASTRERDDCITSLRELVNAFEPMKIKATNAMAAIPIPRRLMDPGIDVITVVPSSHSEKKDGMDHDIGKEKGGSKRRESKGGNANTTTSSLVRRGCILSISPNRLTVFISYPKQARSMSDENEGGGNSMALSLVGRIQYLARRHRRKRNITWCEKEEQAIDIGSIDRIDRGFLPSSLQQQLILATNKNDQGRGQSKDMKHQFPEQQMMFSSSTLPSLSPSSLSQQKTRKRTKKKKPSPGGRVDNSVLHDPLHSQQQQREQLHHKPAKMPAVSASASTSSSIVKCLTVSYCGNRIIHVVVPSNENYESLAEALDNLTGVYNTANRTDVGINRVFTFSTVSSQPSYASSAASCVSLAASTLSFGLF